MPAFSFSAGSLEYAERRLDDVRLSLDAAGGFRLSFAGLQGADVEFLGQEVLDRGMSVEGVLEQFVRDGEALAVRSTLRVGGLVEQMLLRRGEGETRLELAATDQPVTVLSGHPGLPAASGWLSRGRFGASLEIVQADGRPPAISSGFRTEDLSFDSPG